MFLRCKVTAWLSGQGSVWWSIYQIDIRRAMQSFSMIYYFNHHVSAQPYMMLSIDWSQGGIALCRWCCVRCWYRKVFRRPKWDWFEVFWFAFLLACSATMSCKADVLKIRLRLTFLSLSLGMNGRSSFTGAVTFMKLHRSCLRRWRSAFLCVGTTQALLACC